MGISRQDFQEVRVLDRSVIRLHDSIFSGLGPHFQNPDWTRVVVSAARDMLEEHYNALADAALSRGDTAYVVTDAEPPGFQFSLFLPWDYGRHRGEWIKTSLVALDAHMFGQSASWGLHYSYDGYSILGGEPALIDAILSNIGSPDRLWEQFLADADPFIDMQGVGRVLNPPFLQPSGAIGRDSHGI